MKLKRLAKWYYTVVRLRIVKVWVNKGYVFVPLQNIKSLLAFQLVISIGSNFIDLFLKQKHLKAR